MMDSKQFLATQIQQPVYLAERLLHMDELIRTLKERSLHLEKRCHKAEHRLNKLEKVLDRTLGDLARSTRHNERWTNIGHMIVGEGH